MPQELPAYLLIAGLTLLLFYIHAGYPLLMAWLARRYPNPPQPRPEQGPASYSVILCVHNESRRIGTRLDNLLSLDWPGRREIIVVCDGCTDDTAMLARQFGNDVKVLELLSKRGKPSGLNEAVPLAAGDVLIFCDARQTFARDAIRELVAPFADSAIGAVSGCLEIAGSKAGGGQGVDLYWRMERKLREWEAVFNSVIGCTGAIYALRRELYRPLPPDTLLDDVVIPMQAVMAGKRVWFAPQAVAYDPQTLDPALENRRKIRTLAGNYQMLFRHPRWVIPGVGPVWWQLLSHKYLRLAVPWLLVLLLAATAWHLPHPLFAAAFAAQLFCYLLALTGIALPRLKLKVLTIPAGFLLLQKANLQALFAWLASLKNPNQLWGAPSSGASTSR